MSKKSKPAKPRKTPQKRGKHNLPMWCLRVSIAQRKSWHSAAAKAGFESTSQWVRMCCEAGKKRPPSNN